MNTNAMTDSFEQIDADALEHACGGAKKEAAEKTNFLGLKPLNDDDRDWLKWFGGGLVAGLAYLKAHKVMHLKNAQAIARATAAAAGK